MAADKRNLTELAEELHDEAHRLAVYTGTSDFEALRDDLGLLTQSLAARPIGREPAGEGSQAGDQLSVGGLVQSLQSGVQQLAQQLYQTGGGEGIAHKLTADALGLNDLAQQLKQHAVGRQVVPSAPAPKLNTRPVGGTTPGERIRSLDIAGKDFEAALRLRNQRR